MPTYIVKLSDKKRSWYLEWSTIVDAPISVSSSLEEFKEYYQSEYGSTSMDGLEERLTRVEEKGTSSKIHASAEDVIEDVIECNRAGKKYTCLSKKQIIKYYCSEELSEKPMGKSCD